MRHLPRRAAFALPLLLAGCVIQPVNPYPPPPPLQAEIIPPQPRSRVVWEPGTWYWNGATYVWRPGRYVERESGGRFEHGSWVYRGNAWVWVAPGWR